MILAAGLGTRLRPLTDHRPKALVEVGGRTLLDITLARLREFGICEVIVNVHHFAEMIVDYLKANGNFGMRIEISREETLLDTGGGLKKAAQFFLEDRAAEPFLVHNVDVISSIDLRRMAEFHREKRALATLAVQQRKASRYLLFGDELQLCGRQARDEAAALVRPAPQVQRLGFCGVHVISPKIFPLLIEEGVFSIIPAYLRLAGEGERILAFRAEEYSWRDLGKVEDLSPAR